MHCAAVFKTKNSGVPTVNYNAKSIESELAEDDHNSSSRRPFKTLTFPRVVGVKNWAKKVNITMLKLSTWGKEGQKNSKKLSTSFNPIPNGRGF